MHILYIIDFFKPNKGGIEVLLDEIVKHFSVNNKISIITWNFNGKLKEVEKIGNITIYRVNTKNLIHYVLVGYKKAKEIIKDIDIIHGNTFYSALITKKLSKKFKNKKYFIHVHGLFGNFRNNLIEDENLFIKKIKVFKFKLLEKLITSGGKDINYIAISRFVKDILSVYYGVENVKLIYNSIDYKKWQDYVDVNKINENNKLLNIEKNYHLLFFGRAEKLKGWDFLLENIGKYNYEKFTLTMIIYGNNKKLAEKLIQNNLLQNIEKEIFLTYLEQKKDIKILGKKVYLLSDNKESSFKINILVGKEHNKLANYLKTADSIIIPSRMEPFGLVGLESCYLDIPVIVNTFGALEEIVFGRVNFFEYPHQDSLYQAVENSRKGNFKNIPKKDFSLEKMMKKFEKLYGF